MNEIRFRSLCENIGLIKHPFLEEVYDFTPELLPYTVHRTGALSSQFGYRIAYFNEYNDLNYSVWYLPCEDEEIETAIYNLGISIKKLKIQNSIEQINKDFA